MSKYYIGTIDSNNLVKKGFSKVGNGISLLRCLNMAKTEGKGFIAIEPDSSSKNNSNINITGTCYIGDHFDPIDDQGSNDATFEVYPVSDAKCDVDMDCVKGNTKTILINEITKLRKQISDKKNDLDTIKIKLYSLNNNVSVTDAKTQYKMKQEQIALGAKSAQLQDQLNTHSQQLLVLTNASSSANDQLADKNRLLANANTNIQQTYNRLNNVNSQINTITQDIYRNNIDFERKEQIAKTLKSIITIMAILFFVMIIYFGVSFAQTNYPEAWEGLGNTVQQTFDLGDNPFA